MAKRGREKILELSFYLFLKKGYNGTSIQDIMTLTGLSKGAIYHHFQDKKELYHTVVEAYFLKKLEMVGIDDVHLNLEERVRSRYHILCGICGFVEQCGPDGIDFPIRAYYLFQLESERDDVIRIQTEKALIALRSDIFDMIQLAKEREELSFDLDAETIGYQLISMIEGIAIHHSTQKNNCEMFLKEQYEKVIGSYLKSISKSPSLET